jgi:integrase
MKRKGNVKTLPDRKSGQEVAKQNGQASASRYRLEYWHERLFKKTFTRDNARRVVDEWSVRLQHLGQREAFALGSANASTAAAKAKTIATFLEANGWAATLAKFKPATATKITVCTLGEFLADVGKRSHLKPATIRRYAVRLRKLVGDISKLDAGLSAKARQKKYDYVNGGHKEWLAMVDAQSLVVLTPESISGWRNAYVAKAGTDPVERKSAERSAATVLRCSRALFSEDVLAVLKVVLPPSPFAGVKLKDPGPQRYHSAVNPEWLLNCAESELRNQHPQQYLALVLCLWGGLRRKEADTLTWAQIDFTAGQIHIRRTEYFEPKTEESQRTVDLAPAVLDILRGFKEGSQSEFVLDGGDANPAATYDYYRADCTWRDLHAWLKAHGVLQQKAIHYLRKESGSLVATAFGIEAARQHLGHRDIRTTSAHYVQKVRRIEVQLPVAKKADDAQAKKVEQ